MIEVEDRFSFIDTLSHKIHNIIILYIFAFFNKKVPPLLLQRGK